MRRLPHGYNHHLLLLLLLVVLHHVHGQGLDEIQLRKRIVLHMFGPKDMGIIIKSFLTHYFQQFQDHLASTG